MPRKQMWFGNEQHFQWAPAPASGMEVQNVGHVEQIDYQTGRVGVHRSMQTHKEFNMDFPLQEATGLEGLDVYNKYASGFYGDLKDYPLFFADPMNYDQNLFPPGWASPGLYARGWAGIVESGQRQVYNHARNPSAEVDDVGYTRTAGTSGVATGARILTTSVAGNYSYRATWTTATTVVSGGVNYLDTPVVAGQVYDLSAYVTASKIQRVQMTVRWRNNLDASISTNLGTATVLAAGAPTRLTVEGVTAPAGAVSVDIEIAAVAGTSGTVWAIGNWIQMDAVMINYTNQNSIQYLDGDTPGAGWMGTPHASASVMYIPRNIPVVTATPANIYNLPPVQATYDVAWTPNGFPTVTNDYGEIPYAIIPIPPGYMLHFGATGSATGTAQLAVRLFSPAGVPTTSNVPLLSSTGATRMNTTASSVNFTYAQFYIRRTSTAPSTITLSSMMAQLWPIGTSPVLTGDFIEGKGHRGLKFADNATVESYVMVDRDRNIPVHYKGMSTRLVEAQDKG